MKYSVETTENGYVETLTAFGKDYKKEWVGVNSFCHKCKDMDFHEQLELDGYTDEDFLEQVCSYIDDDDLASDLFDISKGFVGCE